MERKIGIIQKFKNLKVAPKPCEDPQGGNGECLYQLDIGPESCEENVKLNMVRHS